MITRETYANGAHRPLIEKYRKRAEECTGSEVGRKLYLQGIAHAERAEAWDQKNYEYSYDFEKHNAWYERRGKRCFLRAMQSFENSAKEGNDLSMMLLALYLLYCKKDRVTGMEWLVRASEAGLACADYQLSAIYEKGVEGIAADPVRAESYWEQYQRRISESERQLILAWDLDEPRNPLHDGWLFAWYHAFPFPLTHEMYNAFPSEWKCGMTNEDIKRIREIARRH